MIINDENKPSLEELMHHGVKGMKWGVSKQRQLDFHNKIAAGNGNRREKLHYKLHVATGVELVKHKGDITKIAAERAKHLQEQKDRIESGNATTGDKWDRALNTSLIDLARGR